MIRYAVVIAVSVFIIAGCQSNPVRITDEAIATRDRQLADLKPWRAQGSLLVNSKQQGAINATFTWDAKASGFDIRLIGPLGLKSYRVTEDVSGARVTGDNQRLTGPSAELLLLDVLGVRVPLLKMQDWVVGLQGSATDPERDRQGRIRKMRVTDEDQTRWNVEFQRYAKVDELQLPKLILVTGDDVKIRLSVRRWMRPDAVDESRLSIPGSSLE